MMHDGKTMCVSPTNTYKSLVDLMLEHTHQRRIWFSLEFFLPYTDSGSEDLIGMVDYFVARKPLFYSIVSRCKGTVPVVVDKETLGLRKITDSTDMADVMVNFCAVETVLHVCWMNETPTRMRESLEKSASCGVRTLFVVRGGEKRLLCRTRLGKHTLIDITSEKICVENGHGDSAKKEEPFKDTVEFISFIRKEFGNQFNIGVAGYPEGHPEAKSYHHCLGYLKEKIDSGADFIISQIFFEADTFINFIRDCRSIGIKCPIIPTILPISSYNTFTRIMNNCKVYVPESVSKALEEVKHDDEDVEKYGIELATRICRSLIESHLVFGFNFCSLNRRTAVAGVLDRLGLMSKSSPPRELPWRQSAISHRRKEETVRPIFWSIRPKSYMYRSATWEQFPNGRWGNPSMASFRDVNHWFLRPDGSIRVVFGQILLLLRSKILNGKQ